MLGAVVTAGLAALALGAAALDPLDVAALPTRLAASSPLVALAAEDGVVVAAGQRGHVLRSDDGGRRWTQASVPASVDLTAVHLRAGGEGLAVGHDGLVLATADGGRTWTRRLDGRGLAALLRARYPCGPPSPAPIAIACEQGAALSLLDVWIGPDGRGLAVGAFGLALFTGDAGRSWTPWLDRVENPRALHLYAVRGVAGELVVAGEQGLLLRLDRARGRLVPVPAPPGGSLFGLVARGREVVAFGLGGRALRSADAGATWTAAAAGTGAALVGGTLLPDGRLVLVSARGDLVASRDGGRTFQPLPPSGLAPAAAIVTAAPGALLVAGAAGVRRAELP